MATLFLIEYYNNSCYDGKQNMREMLCRPDTKEADLELEIIVDQNSVRVKFPSLSIDERKSVLPAT